METLLSCSQRMRYARANENRPAVPKRKQMKVVIVTPSIRIPRRILCEVDEGGCTINRKRNSDDINDVGSFSQHSTYRPQQPWGPIDYGDDD